MGRERLRATALVVGVFCLAHAFLARACSAAERVPLQPVRSMLVRKPAEADQGLVVEGESLVRDAKASEGRVVIQDMRAFGTAWRGNSQLFWSPTQAGARLEVRVNVPAAGNYTVAGYFTKAPDYGTFDVGAEGHRIGSFDGYNAGGVVHSGRAVLGQVELGAGPQVLIFVVSGKDGASAGYYAGIDAIELTPAAAPQVQAAKPAVMTVKRVPLARLAGPVMPAGVIGRMTVRRSPALKVWNGQGGEFRFWQDEVFIDWRRENLNWSFEWSDAGAGAGAVWQVCRFAPPATTRHWETPPGLVASGKLDQLPAGEKSLTFQVDFGAFAQKPPVVAKAQPARPVQVDLAHPLIGGTQSTPQPAAGEQAAGAAGRSVRPVMGSLQLQAARVGEVSLRMIGNPWTYYVRVVVLDAKGQPTGAVSNAVVVHYGEPEHVDLNLPSGPPPPPKPDPRRPIVKIVEYAPIRPQADDATEWFVVTRKMLAWNVGDVLHLTPSEPDVLDQIGDAIGSVAGFFVDAINWVAAAYEDIKKGAVDVVAGAIPGCGETCRGVLRYGLDTGLAAVGLPPDIPNFDELVEMGKGNLAEALVEQAGVADVPLSEELAKKMVDEVVSRATHAASNGPSGTQWLRPLPSKQYRPAFVRVRVTNPPNAGLRDAALTFHAWTLFREKYVPVPNLKPGESREVTIFLTPDYSSWERQYLQEHGGYASSDSNMHAGWIDLYYEGTADMLADATTWPVGEVNLFSGKPYTAGLTNSDYVKQQPSQPYSAP